MLDLNEIGRLPQPGDNCAIATRVIQPGTRIRTADRTFSISHTILEGHRFAVKPIQPAQYLTSWGFPFGQADRAIEAGEYVCNTAALKELGSRSLPIELPGAPNFSDRIPPHAIDTGLIPSAQGIPKAADGLHFQGYVRPGNRGAGTRNYIIALGTTALAGSFVQRLEAGLKPTAREIEGLDGILSVSHTESGAAAANNRPLLLRTLAGFITHPNAGAVLIVDEGSGEMNESLRSFMLEAGYPLEDVPHRFISLTGNFDKDFENAAGIIRNWIEPCAAKKRSAVSLSMLKIALQCGGSDAFSGISGNPLAAWVARELLQHGGSANLAETDELIGAEAYMLDRVRNAEVANQFLGTLDRFKRWAGRHGESAEGNPSGGNIFRGLYNIYLKSLGAAAKRHPEIRLEGVLEYGQPIPGPGFYFMDSPGNDLESIAGQVASGCNLIFFVTGNGSITNFPFVPTIKIVTTTARFRMLERDMDVNAGAYLDGVPLENLGRKTFGLMETVASGTKTAGEQAGHSQVQIWRNWPLAVDQNAPAPADPVAPDGRPLPILGPASVPDWHFSGFRTEKGISAEQVNLIMPTSLCAGQIAAMAADRINALSDGSPRVVALPHTEGCGSSTVAEFIRTVLGYASHPMVANCLFLEHGCEKTHNAFWRNRLVEAGLEPDGFGWASIQLEGGIQPVLRNIRNWFARQNSSGLAGAAAAAGLESVRLGMASSQTSNMAGAKLLAQLVQVVAAAGGKAVIPLHDPLLREKAFLDTLGVETPNQATLPYAGKMAVAGLQVMAAPSADWLETLTGLGATGVDCIIALSDRLHPGHPMIPVLHVSDGTQGSGEMDFRPGIDTGQPLQNLLDLLSQTLSRNYTPAVWQKQLVGFQVTRGRLGVSL